MAKIKIRKVNPIISYASSLIQQNHGESLSGHGFLEWDISSRSFTFHEVANDYGYVTLNIEDGIMPDISRMPRKPRMRVRVVKTDAAIVKDIIKKIKTDYDVDELTMTRIDSLDTTASISSRLHIGDVSDVSYQNSLIEDHLLTNYIVDAVDIQRIHAINAAFNQQLEEFAVPRNVVWSPIRFEFSNMFSYGPNNVLDFTAMKDLVGLFAANRSGKSSIADAISFCLFDKTARAFKASAILNNKKNDFRCKMEFDIGGKRYFIEKKAKRVRDNVRVDVAFWTLENGKKKSLNGEQRRETNAIIRQYVGDYETFVLTTLSVQGKNSQFIDKSQSERKDLFSEFIGTSIFDRLYTLVYDEVKGLKTSLRRANKDTITDAIVANEKRLTLAKDGHKIKIEEHAELVSEKDTLMDELIQLNQSIVEIDASIVDVDALKEAKAHAKQLIVELQKDHKTLLETASLLVADRDSMSATVKNLITSRVEERYKENDVVSKKLTEVTQNIDTIKATIDSTEDRLTKVESMAFDAKCDTCMENEALLNTEAHILRGELVTMRSTLDDLTKKSVSLEGQLDTSIEDEYAMFDTVTKNLQMKEMHILRNESRLQSVVSETAKTQYDIKDLEVKIDKYYKSESTIKRNKATFAEIEETKQTIASLNDLIESTNSEAINFFGEISTTSTRIEDLEEKIKDVVEMEDSLRLYEIYLKCVKRDGIPYELISQVIPVIEGEINNILQQIVDFGIVLHMDGKNINAHLVYDDSSWALDLASGMERFVAGLAIRIALMTVCNLPRSNFMIIDEGMGTLDSESLNTFYLLFDYLKTQFDFILLISHLDSARDMTDDLIEVKKENGFSSVRHIK